MWQRHTKVKSWSVCFFICSKNGCTEEPESFVAEGGLEYFTKWRTLPQFSHCSAETVTKMAVMMMMVMMNIDCPVWNDNRPRELIKDITRLVVACFPVSVVGKTGTYFTQLQCALPFHFLPCTHFKATQSSILQNSPALIFFTWQQWSALVTDHRGYMNMYSALRSSPPNNITWIFIYLRTDCWVEICP